MLDKSGKVCYNYYRKKRKGYIKMTIYEINYKARLDKMLNDIIRKYGHEHEITIWFAELVEKYYDLPCYHNRERLEIYYKKYMKKA